MEKKSTRALSIAVIFLVLGLAACIFKIGSLEKEIDSVRGRHSSEISALRTDMNNIYANVDAQMKRQASILASVEWDFGDPDLDKLTYPFVISVMPKTVSDETRVSATIAEKSIELERDGDLFSGSVDVPLSFRGDGIPIVTVIEGDLRSTEVVENVDVALLSTEFLPVLCAEDMAGRAEIKDGQVVFNTDIFIYYFRTFEKSAVFETAEVLVSVNGSQVDRIDATANIVDISHNGAGNDSHLPFDKSYAVPDGGELVVTVVAVDSFGFTHAVEVGAYMVNGDELAQSVNGGSEQIWAAPGEFSYAEGA